MSSSRSSLQRVLAFLTAAVVALPALAAPLPTWVQEDPAVSTQVDAVLLDVIVRD